LDDKSCKQNIKLMIPALHFLVHDFLIFLVNSKS
jgi:hypothetical protein